MIVNQIRKVLLFCLALALSSCSTYSNKFNCSDAKGLNCMMLSDIDARVDSGEIEEVYKPVRCRGKACKEEGFLKPELVSENTFNAKFKEGSNANVE